MIKLLIVIGLIYLIYTFRNIQGRTPRREPPQEQKIDITTSRFKRGIPKHNIKYRPENELGIISSDHLIYDH